MAAPESPDIQNTNRLQWPRGGPERCTQRRVQQTHKHSPEAALLMQLEHFTYSDKGHDGLHQHIAHWHASNSLQVKPSRRLPNITGTRRIITTNSNSLAR